MGFQPACVPARLLLALYVQALPADHRAYRALHQEKGCVCLDLAAANHLSLSAMEQANAIRHRTQDLVGREEATIVVRKLSNDRRAKITQLREQPQSISGWHAHCSHSGEEQVHPAGKAVPQDAAVTSGPGKAPPAKCRRPLQPPIQTLP